MTKNDENLISIIKNIQKMKYIFEKKHIETDSTKKYNLSV